MSRRSPDTHPPRLPSVEQGYLYSMDVQKKLNKNSLWQKHGPETWRFIHAIILFF
jgi:hypothetical protein